MYLGMLVCNYNYELIVESTQELQNCGVYNKHKHPFHTGVNTSLKNEPML